MTCSQLDSDHWRLSFPEHEAVFIINILARLGRHYQEDIDDLPPALRAYWQGTLTQGKPDEALEESQEMLSEARAELRSERLNLVEKWIQEFEVAEERAPWLVEIDGSERDEFVSMINDRRMMLALEAGITEHDMSVDPSEIEEDARRHTVLEIDILGHFILVVLGPQIYRP